MMFHRVARYPFRVTYVLDVVNRSALIHCNLFRRSTCHCTQLVPLVKSEIPCSLSNYGLSFSKPALPYPPLTSVNKITRMNHTAVPFRELSSSSADDKAKELNERKESLVQRFKKAYAIYGKVVIIIHGLGSCFWLASMYALSSSGINLLDLFEAAHFPEWICKPLRLGGGTVNTWATTLILYKLIAPVRYGCTLFFTTYIVRYMRAKGRVPQLAESDRLRNLARESAQLSRERFKSRISKSRRAALAESKKAKRSLMSAKKNQE